MAHFVISANRTADGGVVYLTADRGWTDRLAGARAFERKPESDAELAWARTREAVICDPHVIKVTLGEHGPAPLDTKQRIRAAGPEATLAALGFLGAASDARHIHRAELPEAPRGASSAEPAEQRA